MKKTKLLAVVMSIVMLMTVLAVFPAAAPKYEAWSLDPATFGTKVTDGPFTFGSVAGDNGAGQIAGENFIPATLNANGTQLDTANGKKLFHKVNGAMCMSMYAGAVGTGYTAAIVFTAPKAGTYTISANFHKWGGAGTTETGLAIPTQSKYVSPAIFSENDVAKEATVTANLSAGEKVALFTRGWADQNITINSFNVILGDPIEATKDNYTSTSDAISFFTAEGGAFTFPNNGDANFVCDYNKDTVEKELVAANGASLVTATAAQGLGKTATSVSLFVKNDKLTYEANRGWLLIKFTAPTCGTFNFAYTAKILDKDGSDEMKEYQNVNNFFLVGNDTDGYDVVRNPDTNKPSRVDIFNHDARLISTTQTLKAGDVIILAVWSGIDNIYEIDSLKVGVIAVKHTGTVNSDKDAANHWTEYSCCGEVIESAAHNYRNGVCECGATDPNGTTPNPNPNPNPSTADTAISVATVIAVMGILGFAVAVKKRH